MSKGLWTAEQWEAVTARGSNILVAAAAGAGKTAVLVERIIQRITQAEEPVDIDRLLVVTFTNAAAAEMRERIARALARALNENPRSRHLQRQLTLINRAPITTLHSFCLELIRQHFYRLDLDPGFRIADDTEAALLRLEVLEDLFESYYEESHPDFLALVECYGGERDDGSLQDLVLRLDDFSRSQPWPQDWLQKVAKAFRLPSGTALEDLPWCEELKNTISLKLSQGEKCLLRALDLCRQPGGPANYEATLRDDLATFSQLQAACSLSWEEMSEAFQGVQFSRLKRCDKDVDEQLKQEVAGLRDQAKKLVTQLKNTYFQRTVQEYLDDFQRLAPLMDFLVRLVSHFQEAYWQAKLKRGLVDFNDLEHLALKLLLAEEATPEKPLPSPLALELQERFVEVLVDEYQDINGVQETILRLISRQGSSAPNLFMVGDVKQSIYRFRLAEPGLFLEKYGAYEKDALLGRRIDLARNFRSRRQVVEGINFIFRQIMTPQLGEMAYDAKAELVYGAPYPEEEGANSVAGPIELHLIDRKTPEPPEPWPEEEEEGAETEELDGIQLEARVVGRCIKKLLGLERGEPYQVYDVKAQSYRPVTYRDIVVLLRATQNSAAIFMEEFRQLGIPAYAELGSGYLAAPEVEIMLSLLKIIDNPRQDIPLAAVLRSPLCGVGQGLTAEQLGQIRLSSPQGDFYQAVQQKAQEDDELGRQLAHFLAKLEEWRTLARRGTLADLIWTIYRETGYYDYVGALPGGIQRQANLRALHDRARQYEKTTYRGLFRFLRFIERLQDSGSDLGTARALGENEDVVRIMSIHKSKGLEFPVVFVAGLGKKFNFTDLNRELLLHKELGLGPNVVDPQSRLSYPSLPKLAISHRLRWEMLAEELRILYVAMTRAREKLFLVGALRDLEKAVGRWCRQGAEEKEASLSAASLASAQCCLDWLVPALSRHRSGGKTLRERAGSEGLTWEDPSSWEVVFWEKQELQEATKAAPSQQEVWQKVRDLEPVEVEGPVPDVSPRLSWVYPHRVLTRIAAKLAVTEVKGRFDPERESSLPPSSPPLAVVERPKFMQQKASLTGAERGSALHLFMQHLDLQRQHTREELEGLLDRLEAQEILTPQQREVIKLEQVLEFLESPLGRRLRQARVIYKELPFSLMLPAQEVYPELEETEEQVLVQGVIDCLAEEDQGLVILDYKTDWVTEEQVDKIVATYRGQLNLYARAVEKILRRPVREKYLFLLSLGRAVEV